MCERVYLAPAQNDTMVVTSALIQPSPPHSERPLVWVEVANCSFQVGWLAQREAVEGAVVSQTCHVCPAQVVLPEWKL